MSAAVTATLVTTVSSPAAAVATPGAAASPGGGLLPGPLNSVLPLPALPAPSLPALPLPLPLPTIVKPPASQPSPLPPIVQPAQPGGPGTQPAQQPAQPAAGAPGNEAPAAANPNVPVTPGNAAQIIANDPGADLYPQVPVDPADTPQARLVARLSEVQHRVQYLHNTIARTQVDLAVAQRQAGAVPSLITVLTSNTGDTTPTAGSYQGSVDSPEGRVLALTSAVASGQGELARRQAEVQNIQQQVNSSIQQAILNPAPVPATAANYGGGKLRRPVPGAITSTFGNRFDPYYHVWQLHAGADIGAPTGTPIVAAAAGRVTQAGWLGGYGYYTCIDHGQVNGQRMSTCYGHQSKILVTVGQQVSAGQVIGQVGSTGASTGPHLHFEVRLGGRPVDPMPWL
ncbi:M23 family metallopeptidase [Planosporangium mesophilum]|uniref:M23 family metallopeptidase n=1 Tax=Planosporangium mesophilum TaxID=689768 RepID=UPI0023B3420D|nr:M23 family metallopeptidase [Planosporangium mesophilum]